MNRPSPPPPENASESGCQLYTGSNAEYHADRQHAGSSVLNDFRRAPQLYRDWELGQDTPLDPNEPGRRGLRLGSALDSLVSGAFEQECAVWVKQDRRTKAGKEAWAQFQKDNRGRVQLSEEEYQDALAMYQSLRETPLAKQLLFEIPGIEQYGVMWTDEKSGVGLKCKWDRLHEDGTVIELKTRRPNDSLWGSSAADWARTVRSRGYHLQAALYMEGARRALGRASRHIFVTVYNEPPWECLVYQTHRDVIVQGWHLLQDVLSAIQHCRDTQTWHASEWNRMQELRF